MGIAPMYNSFAPLFLKLEASMGIAPMYNSFADCRLATWLTGRVIWLKLNTKSRFFQYSDNKKINLFSDRQGSFPPFRPVPAFRPRRNESSAPASCAAFC